MIPGPQPETRRLRRDEWAAGTRRTRLALRYCGHTADPAAAAAASFAAEDSTQNPASRKPIAEQRLASLDRSAHNLGLDNLQHSPSAGGRERSDLQQEPLERSSLLQDSSPRPSLYYRHLHPPTSQAPPRDVVLAAPHAPESRPRYTPSPQTGPHRDQADHTRPAGINCPSLGGFRKGHLHRVLAAADTTPELLFRRSSPQLEC